MQINVLKAAGCSKKNIFTDKVSGTKTERPGLDAKSLKPGDTLTVWRLDRLGRSMSHEVSVKY